MACSAVMMLPSSWASRTASSSGLKAGPGSNPYIGPGQSYPGQLDGSLAMIDQSGITVGIRLLCEGLYSRNIQSNRKWESGWNLRTLGFTNRSVVGGHGLILRRPAWPVILTLPR